MDSFPKYTSSATAVKPVPAQRLPYLCAEHVRGAGLRMGQYCVGGSVPDCRRLGTAAALEMGREAEGEGKGAVVIYRKPCKTMGLVPEMREIKRAVPGRPPYYLV